MPARTMLMAVALLVGVLLVELGVRESRPPGPIAEISPPRVLEPMVGALRSQPSRQVADPRRAAVVSGVVFGRTDGIEEIDRSRFERSGLAHLLAASGQNVALVVACCIGLAWLLGGGRLLGSAWALCAVPAYVLVVGGGPSIVRAGIMAELALVAWMCGRLRDRWYAVALAACVLVWAAPGSHRALGFQLSFACVIVLMRWCVPLTQALARVGVPRPLAGACAASMLCTCVSGPLLLARIGEAPLLGAVANLVAVPIAAVLLVVGLAAAATTLMHPVPGLAAYWLAGWLAQLLLWLAEGAAALPGAATTSWSIVLAPLVLGIAWSVRPSRVLLGVVTAGMALSAGIGELAPDIGSLPAVRTNEVRVAMLDVGQGSAQLVAAEGRAVLVDTGPPRADLARRVRALGVRSVDGVIVTHDSLDHRGGLEEAISRLDPAWVVIPRNAMGDWSRTRALAQEVHEACRGTRFMVGRAQLDVLHPPCDRHAPERTGDLHNDNAMVIMVTVGEVRMLLSSDAESPVTIPFHVGDIDVLQVGHHGSSDPQLPGLLRATTPRLAGISSGAGNSYGHPRSDTLAALDAAHVEVARTDRDGSIVIETDGTRLWTVPR